VGCPPFGKMAAVASRADAFSAAKLVPQLIFDIGYFGGIDPDYPKAKLDAAAKDLRRFAPLLRCVFNPFRPVVLDPAWLAWNGGAVRKMAQAIYEKRRFADLPILADALEEAGCTDAAILAHCRGGGEHVRGCWVVDLLTGRR